jgi:hypothetical protein
LAVTILVSQLTTTEHLRGLALQPMQQAAWHPAHGCLAQMVTYHFQMAALKPLPTQAVAVAQVMSWSTVATQLHLTANGVLTIGANATISNEGEFRLWATDTDITVYRNGQDGYGVKAGNIETFTDNALRTVTNSNGFEIKTGNIIIPNNKGVVFANGVNILSTVDVYGNTQVASYLLNFDGDIEFTSSTARIGNVDVITVMDSVRSPVYRFVNGSKITGIGNNLNIQTTTGVPGGPVTKISDNQGWGGGSVGTNLPTTGGTGTGLTVDVGDSGSGYAGISINTPGTGYTNGDVLTVTNGGMSDTFSISVPVSDWQFGNTGITTIPSTLTTVEGNITIQVPSGIPVGVANWEGGGGWNQAFYSNIGHNRWHRHRLDSGCCRRRGWIYQYWCH